MSCATHLVNQATILSEDGVDQGGILRPVAVSNIVDADPDTEESVVTLPDLAGAISSVLGQVLVLDLLLERDNGIRVGCNKIAVNRGASIRKVVCLKQGGVVLVGEVSDPVGPAAA